MNDIGFYQSPGCREINEDTLFHLRLTLAKGDVHILGVADGMGGMAAGEVASQQAVETVQNILVRGLTLDGGLSKSAVQDLVRTAIEEANTDILARANGTKMGSTMTCAVIDGGTCVLGHIGDCRAYVLSGSGIVQETKDHAVGNALTKRLGKTKTVSPDVQEVNLDKGDTLVLCSDGLHGPLTDQDIEEEFATAGPAKSGCIRVVQEALRRGGPRCDNISVVAYRNGPAPAPQPRQQARVIQRNGERRVEPSIQRNVEAESVRQGRSPGAVGTAAKKKERLLTIGLVALTVLVLVLAGLTVNLLLQSDAPEAPAPATLQSDPVQPPPSEVKGEVVSSPVGGIETVLGEPEQSLPEAESSENDEQGGMMTLLLQIGLAMLTTAGICYWLFAIKLPRKKNRYNR